MKIDWSQKNIVKISNEIFSGSDEIDTKKWRAIIEPWLSSVFQSEHLSLFVGSGLTIAVSNFASTSVQSMNRINFGTN